jgi:uncharacterized protein YndB with AHSA1/START domain
MAALTTSISIAASPAKVFHVVTDLQSYNDWLPSSGVFAGTTEISDSPIKLGTTYIETTPIGVKHGRVTEFVQDKKVTFVQPFTLEAGGVVDVRVGMDIDSDGEEGCTLTRRAWLALPEEIKELREGWEEVAEVEGRRVLEAMKVYIESLD